MKYIVTLKYEVDALTELEAMRIVNRYERSRINNEDDPVYNWPLSPLKQILSFDVNIEEQK